MGKLLAFRTYRESSDVHPLTQSLSGLSYLDSLFMVVLLLNGIKHMTEEVCSAVMLHIPTGVFRLVRRIAGGKKDLASSCLSVRLGSH